MTDALGRVRSALVLGGGSEIALATLDRLAIRGLRRAVLLGRRPEVMREAARELVSNDVEVITLPFDADAVDTHHAVIADAFARYGDFDLVLMTFGTLGDQATFESDPAAAGHAAITNYAGAVSSGMAAGVSLRAQGHGTLVVLSSVAGQRPRRDNYVYGSAKAGLDAFARGLGEALHGTGAHVMVVRPGFVRTKMTAGMKPRVFAQTADQVAGSIVNGLDRGASVVWAPAPLRLMFMVLNVLPQSIFRRLKA